MKLSLLDFNHRFNGSLFSRAHSLIDNGDWYFSTMAPIILLAIPAVLIPYCLTLFFLAVFYGIVAMLIETFFSNYAAYKLQHMLTAVARERFSNFNREEVVAYTLLSTLTLHSNKLYCIRIESKQFQQKFEQLLLRLPRTSEGDTQIVTAFNKLCKPPETSDDILDDFNDYLSANTDFLLYNVEKASTRLSEFRVFIEVYRPYINKALYEELFTYYNYLNIHNKM